MGRRWEAKGVDQSDFIEQGRQCGQTKKVEKSFFDVVRYWIGFS